jgi:hypothetical protein
MRRRIILIFTFALVTTIFLAVLVTRDIVEDPGSPEIYGYDFLGPDLLSRGQNVRIRGFVRYPRQDNEVSAFWLVTTFPPTGIEVYAQLPAPSSGSFVEVKGTLSQWEWGLALYLNNANWHYSSPIVVFLDFVKSVTITVLPFLIIASLLILGASLIKLLILHRRSKRINENLGFEYD